VEWLSVPADRKRKPPFPPPAHTRIYFISVAPPWGGAYFWDESRRDAVRQGLFHALRLAGEKSIDSCSDFVKRGFYLTPAVKCASHEDDKDHHPAPAAIANCRPFLLAELEHVMPDRILALGQTPFRALCGLFSISAPHTVRDYHDQHWSARLGSRSVIVAGTYFTGNDRHGGFSSGSIVKDIRRLLSLRNHR
jgi:Uracil DNA glycosylase superfamily